MAKRYGKKKKKRKTKEIGGIKFEMKPAKGSIHEFAKFLDRHHPRIPPWVAEERFGIREKDFERAGGYKKAKDEFFKKFFNRSAPVLYPLLTSEETYLTMMRSLTDYLKLKGNEKILSVGSGTGLIETFLAKKYLKKGGEIYNLDFAKGMNVEAKRIAKEEGVKNVHFMTADAKHLPIKTRNIDYLISIDALHWVKEYPKAFNEMMRVMSKKPGSKLIFTFTPGHKRSDIDVKRIANMAKRNNMEIKRVGILPTEVPITLKGKEEPAGRIMLVITPKEASKKAFKEKHSK